MKKVLIFISIIFSTALNADNFSNNDLYNKNYLNLENTIIDENNFNLEYIVSEENDLENNTNDDNDLEISNSEYNSLSGDFYINDNDYLNLYKNLGLENKIDVSIFKRAYNGYRVIQDKNPGILGIIDYTKPSSKERLFIIDLDNEQLLFSSLVAHSKNSGVEIPYNFSNFRNSLQSSIGFYLTGNTYNGKYGYSLILKGLEERFNSNAEARKIVIHGSTNINEESIKIYGFLNRSLGCPEVPMEEVQTVVDLLKENRVLFIAGIDENYDLQSQFK